MPEDISWPSQIACVMMENQKRSRPSGLSLRSGGRFVSEKYCYTFRSYIKFQL